MLLRQDALAGARPRTGASLKTPPMITHAALMAVTQTPGGISGYSEANSGRSQASRGVGSLCGHSERRRRGIMPR